MSSQKKQSEFEWGPFIILCLIGFGIFNAISGHFESDKTFAGPRSIEKYQSPGEHYVSPYRKSNGTYVNGYWRTNPNHTTFDNYSGPNGSYYRRLNGR